MIARLSGEIVHKAPDYMVVDVGGVGYQVHVPLSVFCSVPASGAITLFIHTAVREDAINLYGFLTMFDRELFSCLLSISGVGPKLALAILSNMQASEFCRSIEQHDIRRLSSVPGIGKKTAERLLLELKEKIHRLAPPETDAPALPSSPEPSAAYAREDALTALVALGYKEHQAQKALDQLDVDAQTTVEQLLRGALKLLSP